MQKQHKNKAQYIQMYHSLFFIHLHMHSPEKRNGSSGLTARRSASVERCEMAVTRD